MIDKILVFGVLAILLFGCAQPISNPPTGKTFELGVPFAAEVSTQPYTNSANNIQISVVSFADSRCPQNALCVWAGELGVNLEISYIQKIMDSLPLNSEKIYLGETTNKKAGALGYDIELISIEEKSRPMGSNIKYFEVTLKISKAQGQLGDKWFSYDLLQCNSNPWDEGQWQVKRLFRNYEDRVTSWLGAVHNVNVKDYAEKEAEPGLIVCDACSCPSGKRVAVLVPSDDFEVMALLGWEEIGNENGIACTMDAKICPNGGAVGRTAPFCEFSTCSKPNFIIKQTDVPGFVIDPVEVVTTIYADGIVTITTTSGRDGNSTTKNFQISAAKLAELKNFILASDVFDITEEDARICIADSSTKNLAIYIDGAEVSIYQIGAECEKENLAAAYSVLNKIESTLKTAKPQAKIELFDKKVSWGPCPSYENGACTDNYTLYYSGEVIHNGDTYRISSSDFSTILTKIRADNLNSESCFLPLGTDYFVTYKIFIDGKEFVSDGWLSEKCKTQYAEIESLITKRIVNTDPKYPA